MTNSYIIIIFATNWFMKYLRELQWMGATSVMVYGIMKILVLLFCTDVDCHVASTSCGNG